MSPWLAWTIGAVLFPLLGYLIGSVPCGFLAGRIRGVDIRTHGSGNIGATNVARLLGRKWGLAVFALDVLKGALPVVAAGLFLKARFQPGPAMFAAWLLTAFAAIAGHVWCVWLKFKGGKGVATALGVVLGLWPYFTLPGLVALGVWIFVALVSRYVSLGSICAAVTFPAALVVFSVAIGGQRWAAGRIWPLLVFGGLVPLMILWRHRANIGRLLAGTESRIGGHRRVDDDPAGEIEV